jgi:hypothetical protein
VLPSGAGAQSTCRRKGQPAQAVSVADYVPVQQERRDVRIERIAAARLRKPGNWRRVTIGQ